MMNRNFLLVAATAALLGACKKELDSPPERTIPVGSVLTIKQLKTMYTTGLISFGDTDQLSIYGVVTSDETDGNFYKNISIQDSTGGITLRLVNSGGLYIGDRIRVYLPGTTLDKYHGLMQLGNVNVDNNVIKQEALVTVAPLVRTIDQLTPAALDTIQSMLIQLNDVEFSLADVIGGTWADAVNQTTGSHFLENCALQQVEMRTSGYASYAGQALPTGKGSIMCIAGVYDGSVQMSNRRMSDVHMDGTRCPGQELPTLCDPVASVNESFTSTVANVNIALSCWNNQAQTGSRFWRGYSQTSDMCAQATAFGSSNGTDVAWLITPPTTYTPGMTLSFRSQRGFGVASHDPFALFISTNYDISNLSSANWSAVPCTYATPSTSDQVWVPSGSIDLSTVLPAGYSGNFVIGFRYTGSGPSGNTTNFRIDDVVIQ